MFNKKSHVLKMFAASVAVMGLAACGASASSPSTVAQPAPAATQVEAATSSQAAAATTAPAPAATQVEATTAPQAATATTAPVVAPATKFNLNTATAEQIKSAPNTGSRMVREFSEYRPYTSIAQFRKEIGKYVDAAQVAEYEKYFYVPVVPNTADAATLQQLPSVDAAIADKLIAARPYADPTAFLKKLGELTSADNAAAAASYVEAQ